MDEVTQWEVVACAEAGRQLLVGRFHALGLAPTSLTALNVPLDGAAGKAQTWLVGGHLGENPDPSVTSPIDPSRGLVQVNQVSLLPDNAFGPVSRARDITNTVSLIGQGGKPLRVIAHCVDAGGRQLEVEFGVRFGL